METSTTNLKHCDLLKVSGRIDSTTSPQMDEALKAILNAKRYNLVVDMKEVTYMSSAGMRVLINAQKVCRRYNRGEVILVGVSPLIYEAMELAGFTVLFKFFDDPLLAVGYF